MTALIARFSSGVFRYVALFCISLVASVLVGQSPPKDAKTGQDQPGSPAPLPDGNDAVDKMNQQYIAVYRTIMTPKNVADTFGRRIAKRYIAMQITVANRNKDYQWLIQDASMRLDKLLNTLQQRSTKCSANLALLLASLKQANNFAVSSADLTVLRGVAEKGQSLDPRNVAVRSLTGAGIIAAGLIGVTDFGHSFAPGVAAFNGPFINAIKEVFPDYTIDQLNRLNDSAYLANTVVGKQQAKVIVIFIPQPYLLTSQQQKQFYKDPESIFGCPDLRLLEASVDGNFIATVTATPVATSVNIQASDDAKFKDDNFTINGTIVGNFFSDTTIELVSPPQGLTIKADGASTDKAIKFILTGTRPLAPQTAVEFAIKGKSGDAAHVSYHVMYTAAPPTLTSMDPTSLKVGQSATITLAGTGFLPDGMTILLDPSAGLTAGFIQFTSSKEIKFDLAASASIAEGQKTLRISSVGGLSPQTLKFTVSK
jgi:hypothetical protein